MSEAEPERVPDQRAWTRRVLDVTGLTVSALARKMRVSSADVRAWSEGAVLPPARCLDVLGELLQRAAASEPTPTPRVCAPRIESQVVCGDCTEALRELPDASVDMLLSDIPYGIGLDTWDVLHDNENSAYLGSSEAQERAGKVFARRRKPINGWSAKDRQIPAEYARWCAGWAGECLRVLRPGGSALIFAGRRFVHRCVVALEDAGFNARDMLAWIRPRAVYRAQRLSVVYQKRGDLADAARWAGWRVGNLRPSFEPIVWCFKPYAVTIAENVLDHGLGAMHADRFAEITGGPDNVLRFGFEPGESGLHEAQKPLALMRALIELCTTEDQLVLDPFAGSGSTALAAKQLGRRCIAIERDPALCATIEQRLGAPNGVRPRQGGRSGSDPDGGVERGLTPM